MEPFVVVNQDFNPWKSWRRLRTVALFWGIFMLGMAVALFGPSLLALEDIYETSPQWIASGITSLYAGVVAGSVLCGFIYGPLNKELLLAASVLLMSVSTAFITYGGHVLVFIVLMTLRGLSTGLITTAAQSYLLKLTEDKTYRRSLLQALHCAFSLGATIGPFIIKPLLKTREEDNPSELLNGTNYNTTTSPNSSYWDVYVVTPGSEDAYDSHRIGLAFVIVSGFNMVSCVLFLVAFFLVKPSIKDTFKSREVAAAAGQAASVVQSPPNNPNKRFIIPLLIISFFLFFFIRWAEILPGNFLPVFVVNDLGFDQQKGSLVVSAYWAAHTFSRMAGIPLSRVAIPKEMVISDLVITFCGFLVLTVSSFHVSLLWIGVVLAGFGNGTLFASSILWLEEYVKISGRVSSVLVTASAAGGSVSPSLTAFLMQYFNDWALVLIMLTASIINIIVFLGALYLIHKAGTKRKYLLTAQQQSQGHNDDPDEKQPMNKPLNSSSAKDVEATSS